MRRASRFVLLPSALSIFAGLVQAQPPARDACFSLTHIWTSQNPEDPQDLHVTGINDKGEIVGYGAGPHASQGAFLWRKGRFIDLGARIGHAQTLASAINDRGDVVGNYSDDGREFHAFLLRHGRVIDIEGVPGEGSTLAFDINNRRQVIVGRTERPELPNYTNSSFFLWKRGDATQLEPLEPADGASANHLNDHGITVGVSVGLVSTAFRAVLWQDGTVMHLGAPEGAESADAVDINNRGQVAVNVITHVEERLFTRPFIWYQGEFIELQLMGDAPYGARLTGINDQGVVIGTTSTLPGEFLEQIPTLWRNGRATDVQTLICSSDPLQPYVQLGDVPLLINDRGQIVMMATDSRVAPWSGLYLLTPRRS